MRTLFDTEKYISTVKVGVVGDNEAHAMSKALMSALNEGVATSDDLVKSGAQIDFVAARVDVLRVHVEALNTKIDGVTRNFDDKIGGLNAKVDGVARTLEDKIGGLNEKTGGLNEKIGGVARHLNDKMDSLERNLRTEMDARFHVHKVWLMIIAAMVAFSNPFMMAFYKAIGIFP